MGFSDFCHEILAMEPSDSVLRGQLSDLSSSGPCGFSSCCPLIVPKPPQDLESGSLPFCCQPVLVLALGGWGELVWEHGGWNSGMGQGCSAPLLHWLEFLLRAWGH